MVLYQLKHLISSLIFTCALLGAGLFVPDKS